MIDISKMDKAEVLAKLFNASKQQGMGALDPRGTKNMTAEQARKILPSGKSYFDYLYGRVLKVDLSDDHLDPTLYDRDNGPGAAARALGVAQDEKRAG